MLRYDYRIIFFEFCELFLCGEWKIFLINFFDSFCFYFYNHWNCHVICKYFCFTYFLINLFEKQFMMRFFEKVLEGSLEKLLLQFFEYYYFLL